MKHDLMNKMTLRNFVYFIGEQRVEDKDILIEDDIIKSIFLQRETSGGQHVIDLKGNYLVPGFVDLQVNGGSDVFFSNDISEEALEQIYKDHLRYGTTCILPTLISSPLPDIIKAIEVVRAYMQHKPGVAGLHIEGPFLNLKKKGAHNPAYLRKPSDEELRKIVEEGEGVIKMMTIAPELFTDKQIAYLLSKDILLSIGHSIITSPAAQNYFSKGINCVTHLFNAMSQFESREPGLVGATLDSDVYAGIIVDGVHCDYTSVSIAHRLKKEKLFLVSDATFISTKRLRMNGIEFIPTEKAFVNAEGNLAGSRVTISDAVRNCVDEVGIPLAEVIKMATSTPLEVIGLSAKYGRIEPDCKADLVILSKDDLRIDGVIKNGHYLSFKN